MLKGIVSTGHTLRIPRGLKSSPFTVYRGFQTKGFLNKNQIMDEGTIKIPNPKCRLYWCLIEFTGWRYSQSC